MYLIEYYIHEKQYANLYKPEWLSVCPHNTYLLVNSSITKAILIGSMNKRYKSFMFIRDSKIENKCPTRVFYLFICFF